MKCMRTDVGYGKRTGTELVYGFQKKRTMSMIEKKSEKDSEKDTIIDRQIEDSQGKVIRETERSTTHSRTRSSEATMKSRETITTQIKLLHSASMSEKVSLSFIARQKFIDLEENRSEFYKWYPDFVLKGNETDMNKFDSALMTFAGAPFVDFSWQDIFLAKEEWIKEDLVNILLNKLIWKAVHTDTPTNTNDENVIINLLNVDQIAGEAKVQLYVTLPHGNVNLELLLDQVDPFLLMLLPNKKDRQRVQTITECMGQEALAALQ